MEERKSILEELQTASPLESAKLLQEIELYDAKSSQEIIDEVYKEFAGNQQKVENIVVPVFTSIADGFLKKGKVGEALKKKGLTATRIVSECQNFTYDEGVDTYSEIIKDRVISENSKNQKSFNDRIDSDITQEYDREGSNTDTLLLNMTNTLIKSLGITRRLRMNIPTKQFIAQKNKETIEEMKMILCIRLNLIILSPWKKYMSN